MDKVIYDLQDRIEAWIKPVPYWVRKNAGTIFCEGCLTLRRDRFPTPVDVPMRVLLPKHVIGIAADPYGGTGVIRRDLFDLLRPHLADYAIGRCLDEKGDVISSHVTYYSRSYITHRHGPEGRCRRCEYCGAIWPRGDAASISYMSYELVDRWLFQDRGGGVYALPELVDALNLRKFPGIRCVPFPVLDAPRDGYKLPSDPGWVVGKPPEVYKSFHLSRTLHNDE